MGRIQFFRNMKHKETDQILNEVLTSDAHMVQETLADLNRKAFSLAVDTILRSSDIYILGVRNSAPLAEYLAFYLNTIFPHVRLIHTNSASEIYEQMLHVGPKDVVIGISFPRYSNLAVHAVEFAKSRGAQVIAITDSKLSPLYKAADASLLVRSEMISFVDSMATPLSLLTALIVAVGRQKNEEVSGTFAEMERIWSAYSIFGKTEDE